MNSAATRAVPASCAPLAAPDGFELWRVDLKRPLAPEDLTVLDEAEIDRAARFAFEHLARRYRAAHVALRTLLADPAGAPPAALRFAFGPHGKPRLAGAGERPAFNLSDSADVALVAIAADGDIGIDVEILRPVTDALELADLHFCSREVHWLASADAAHRDRSFLRVWARKEACLKALGSGLSLPAASFDGGPLGPPEAHGTVLAPAWSRVTIPTAGGVAAVEVIEIHAGADCVAALARQVRSRR